MTHQIVDALVENQKDRAADVRPERYIVLFVRLAKLKSYISRGQDVARESAHAQRQMAEVVFLRVYRPYDVAHRIDQLARRASDHRERLGGRRTAAAVAVEPGLD